MSAQRQSASARNQTAPAAARTKRRSRARQRVIRGGCFLLAATGAIIFVMPLVWLISIALTEPGIVTTGLPTYFLTHPHWSNFADAINVPTLPNTFLLPVWNSTWYTSLEVLGDTFVSAVVAYAFARLRARGATTLFFIMLATIMIPYQVTMLPQIVVFRLLGWIDTPLPLIVPHYFGNAFAIFLLRQFFRGLPRELDDAATIDGFGYLGIFWRVIVPQSKAALATVAMLTFFFGWTDLLGPLIYLNTPSKYPVSLALSSFVGGNGYSQPNPQAAAMLISALPCAVLFFVGQRYFNRGLAFSGVQG